MQKKCINSIKHKLQHIAQLVLICLIERKFIYNGTRVKYLFVHNKNKDILVIGFQACHPEGARYNYVRSIKDLPINRLYIKDDFSSNHRGSYYLGENGKNNVESCVYELINTFIKKLNPKKIVFIGSSKGAYAALNFGLTYRNSYMVIASPQYYLGNYLNNDYQIENLKDILGNITDEGIINLNNRLRNKILANKEFKNQHIYMHYSDMEHTYKEHIKYLIKDLTATKINIDYDVQKYKTHGELYQYFPKYLRDSLLRILGT